MRTVGADRRSEVRLQQHRADGGRFGGLGAQRLDRPYAHTEDLGEGARGRRSGRGMNDRTSRPANHSAVSAQVREGERGACRLDQSLDGRRLRRGFSRGARKEREDVVAPDAREVRTHPAGDGCRQDAETEQIGQARPLPRRVSIERVVRVLALDVAEGVVRVTLVDQGPDARGLERDREREPPAQGGRHVVGEGARDRAVRDELRVEMVVRRPERDEATVLALLEDDARQHAEVGDAHREWPVVFES